MEDYIKCLLSNLMQLLQIAGKINGIIREQGLREVGQLEQDLVFGDAGTKELINFLRTKQVKMSIRLFHMLTIPIVGLIIYSLFSCFSCAGYQL